MPRVQARLTIHRPPTDVFALLADPTQRMRLLPDNFSNARVTSEARGGPGTRIAFTIVTPASEHDSEFVVRDWEPPTALTEEAPAPDSYTMTWRFHASGSDTDAHLISAYRVSGWFIYRIIDRLFARKALEQSLLIELHRLKRLAETGEV